MMSKTEQSRAEILDLLLQRHKAGDINWTPREAEGSYQAELAEMIFHIDRKLAGKIFNYFVWVFKDDQLLDRIDAEKINTLKPADGEMISYPMLVRYIFNDIQDDATAKRLSPVIEGLKKKN
jgi:hypothetical protein